MSRSSTTSNILHPCRTYPPFKPSWPASTTAARSLRSRWAPPLWGVTTEPHHSRPRPRRRVSGDPCGAARRTIRDPEPTGPTRLKGAGMGADDNIKAIQAIYEAFGRGDVATILEALTDDVDWATDTS